jgi:hypothetical protein
LHSTIYSFLHSTPLQPNSSHTRPNSSFNPHRARTRHFLYSTTTTLPRSSPNPLFKPSRWQWTRQQINPSNYKHNPSHIPWLPFFPCSEMFLGWYIKSVLNIFHRWSKEHNLTSIQCIYTNKSSMMLTLKFEVKKPKY